MTRFDENVQSLQENNNAHTCNSLPMAENYRQETPAEMLNTNTASPSEITSLQPHKDDETSHSSALINRTMERNSLEPEPPLHSVSSSDLIHSNFPLKERNYLPKLRESTSFDPREPQDVPRSSTLVSDSSNISNGKENKNSQTAVDEDNTIQCNEVSSSNIDIDNVCNDDDEEVESSSGGAKVEKHNLRSGKKAKNGDHHLKEVEEEKIKVRN